MTTYNTGNPLGSAAAKDLFDNAQNLDFAVNSITQIIWQDRFGRNRKTWFGIQKDAQEAIAAFGYITMDSFEDGATLNLPNQTLRYESTGEYYRWDGEFPKVVAPGSTPETSGGVSIGAWISVGDAVLRSQLSDPESATKYPELQVARWRDQGDVRGWGLPVEGDVTLPIIAALGGTDGIITIPESGMSASPTISQLPSVLAFLSRAKFEGPFDLIIPPGVISLNEPTLIACESGQNLTISGQANIPVSITGQVSVSGAAGGYSVTLSLNDASNAQVGNYLLTYDATGTANKDIHRGTWKITAVDSNNITVTNTCRMSSFPVNTITSSQSVILKSVLSYKNCDGIVNPSSVLGKLVNVVIEGNADEYWLSSNVSGTEKGTHGITVGANTVISNGATESVNPLGISGGIVSCGQFVGVTGFDQQGVVTELGGNFYGDYVCSCNNKRRGFYASTASGIRAKNITANGNYLDGVIADIGGSIYSSSKSCAAGNGSNGLSSTQNGQIIFDTGIAVCNGLNGVSTAGGGLVQITGGNISYNVASGIAPNYGGIVYCDTSNISNNGTYGVYAQFMCTMRMPNCTINNNGQYGLRLSYMSYATYTGTTFTGNVAGDVTFTIGSLGVNNSRQYGGEAYASGLTLALPSTGKGARIVPTSGGDDIIFYHDVDGAGTFTAAYHMRTQATGFYPELDATANNGSASRRWNVGFFAGGTQSSSDARLKDPVREMTSAEISAAKQIAGKLGFWTWLDDDAKRLHAGTTVQTVIEILTENGLDWTQYGFIGYDKWDDEYEPVMVDDGEGNLVESGETKLSKAAGDLYQFRDQELDRFIMRGLAQRLSDIESKLPSQ